MNVDGWTLDVVLFSFFSGIGRLGGKTRFKYQLRRGTHFDFDGAGEFTLDFFGLWCGLLNCLYLIALSFWLYGHSYS